MPLYRKKPIVIEAIQWNGQNYNELKEFVGRSLIGKYDEKFPNIYVHTLEGDLKISVGDYVIKGLKGEFYPCKPDIFDQTYTLAMDINYSDEFLTHDDYNKSTKPFRG